MPNISPKVSIVLPIHDMKNGAFFLWRAINSIMEQTFKDYEIVIIKEGSMPENTNAGIKKAKGEIVKILYMDDWFAHPNVLWGLVNLFDRYEEVEWHISPCDTNPDPELTDDLHLGNNKLGSPSTLAFRNHFEDNLLFDEKLSWLLDCDLYKRMRDKFGNPSITAHVDINIGVGDHQVTHLMPDSEKLKEHEYVKEKYNG